MTIRLRPHHLLCVLAYVGKGYSARFTANYDLVVQRIAEGEDIVIVGGPDDICAPLLGDAEPHCWRESVIERDRAAARDLSTLLGTPIDAGVSLSLESGRLKRMRAAFAERSIRGACAGCEWQEMCNAIAASGFVDVVLPTSRE
ncbi:DUF1284 domain-containing protein [Pelagibacterium flavum]|uniref:DUF1284 domain-containing protein n=1 Tax=Pelagibacterium flavum TaxID=2984530 RepID=A0ABY6IQC3_9HYPH|nr:2Fe-2S ferredoxin [Hyphomicrobiales bacterium]UYQ72773.1 DUF1284 domain-containing protein [Pelagibacterium sp. YIM 151497]|tara:strand:+ start:2041 stop:2472 length:432 start_codon:yes stop_codon:yes gene_type:complete